jgi:hypothetical protein
MQVHHNTFAVSNYTFDIIIIVLKYRNLVYFCGCPELDTEKAVVPREFVLNKHLNNEI